MTLSDKVKDKLQEKLAKRAGKINGLIDTKMKKQIEDALYTLNILEDNQLTMQQNQVEFESYLKDILSQVTAIRKHLGMQSAEVVDADVIEVHEDKKDTKE